MRQHLINLYLDYVNNYLTIGKFAEHNEISNEDAINILKLGKKYHEEYARIMRSELGDNDYKSNRFETGR